MQTFLNLVEDPGICKSRAEFIGQAVTGPQLPFKYELAKLVKKLSKKILPMRMKRFLIYHRRLACIENTG